MKKGFLFILFLTLICSVSFAATFSKGKNVYISTDVQELKASTGFFAQVKGTMALGDTAKVLEQEGKWVKIQSVVKPTLVGWVPAGALTTKKIKKNSKVTASASEVALAGKGWNKEIEAKNADDMNLNFKVIDEMEALSIEKDVLFSFLNDGSLKVGE